MVEADLIACMIALPPQLFRTTAIPACLWFLVKDKGPQAEKRLSDRRGETLFIDARSTGVLVNRTERILTDDDITGIADAYHAWRGTPSARAKLLTYEDIPGFSHSATLEEIREHNHVLTPGRYVGAAETQDDDGEPVVNKIERLTKELLAHFDESARLEQIVRTQLERVNG
jgi:type I restriction enzyme M protein